MAGEDVFEDLGLLQIRPPNLMKVVGEVTASNDGIELGVGGGGGHHGHDAVVAQVNKKI